MTVDFGFYRTAIGDLVFVDADENGANGAGDFTLSGATVQLFSGDNSTQIGSNLTTTGTGLYSFTGLPEGNYIVRVTPPLGYASTVDTADAADTTDPDNNINNNDNGIGVAIGAVPSSSGQLTMTPGETGTNITVTSGNTTDTSVDFGFVPLRFSLGNRVWYDTDNDGVMDIDLVIPANSEVGIPGVRVELYRDTNNSNLYDAGDTFLSFDTTDTSGYYRFDDLLTGNYIVMIADDNFRNVAGDTVPGNPLLGYRSSLTTIADNGTVTDATSNDPDTLATDNDDNGRTTNLGSGGVNYVASAAVTLGPDTNEPIGDNDPLTNPETGEEVDNQSNRTVDFGFYRLEIGNLVFIDNGTFNGAYDLGETLLANAQVRLYSGNNGTQIFVGADGILGFGTDNNAPYVTGAGGTYSFSGLPAGNYVVRVTPPAAPPEYASTLDTANSADTTDPDTNTDNNDNGIGENAGQVSSGQLTLAPGQGTGGSAGAPNNVVTNLTAITSDPTVDFGFIVPQYFLGNRVWFDTDNDSTINGAEQGIDGVLVELYQDTNNDNVPDGGSIANMLTAGGGYYRFDNLAAGNYIVRIPNDNFDNSGINDVLAGYWSSGTTIDSAATRADSTANDPDAGAMPAIDRDENGLTTFTTAPVGYVNYIQSNTVTLGATSEPIGETDPLPTGNQGTTYDNRANMTVDFGFYRVGISDQIFVDEDGSGTFNAGDTAMSGAIVQLFASNAAGTITTEVRVGPDGVLGTIDDALGGITTTGTGLYLFQNLPDGLYVIRVHTAQRLHQHGGYIRPRRYRRPGWQCKQQ